MTGTMAPTRPQLSYRPRRRRRRWPWVFALVLVLAMAGGAFYLVRFTPVLGVRSVAVSGVPTPLAQRVRDAIDVPVGTPLITLDAAALAARAEAAVPEVESVRVSRHWPNSLVVVAVARTPVAVTSANAAWWLLDRHGVPYLKVASPPAKLLAIELATPGSHDPATLAAVEVVHSLPAGVTRLVASVVARSPYRITLTLHDGRVVVWGDATQVQAKAAVLPVLLKQPGHTYDISDPTLATVR